MLPYVLLSSAISFFELTVAGKNHTHEVMDTSDDFSPDPDTLNAPPFMPHGRGFIEVSLLR